LKVIVNNELIKMEGEAIESLSVPARAPAPAPAPSTQQPMHNQMMMKYQAASLQAVT